MFDIHKNKPVKILTNKYSLLYEDALAFSLESPNILAVACEKGIIIVDIEKEIVIKTLFMQESKKEYSRSVKSLAFSVTPSEVDENYF